MAEPAISAEAKALASGRLLGLGTAAAFGSITTLARLSYQAGAEPLTLTAVRSLLAVVLLGGLALALKRRFAIARADWPALALNAFGIFGMTVGYLGSVAFIPVSLAALLFYTFPLMVAAATPIVDRRRLSRAQALAFLLAFAGLALTLGPSLAGLDPRGVALALFAAVCVCGLLFTSRRLTARYEPLALAAQSNLLAFALVLPLVFAFGGPRAPVDAAGWLPFAAAAGFYVLGVALQFFALRLAGAADVALVLNLEPVVSILAAVALLGERLAPAQWGGAALVIAALFLSARGTRRRT